MANVNKKIDSADRLSFTLFLALTLHSGIILGITFQSDQTRQSEPITYEVTMARFQDEKNDDADFLAQFNQQGSGQLDEAQKLSTTETAELTDSQIQEAAPLPAPPVYFEPSPQLERVLTAEKALLKAKEEENLEEELKQSETQPRPILDNLKEIQSMEANLAILRENYAKRPRIKTLTSESTREDLYASYLNTWSQQIESYGNQNYPAQARLKRIYGKLRLLVRLRPNGSVDTVKLLEPSGEKILDNAALKIAKLAGPYAPFTDEIRAKTDILEIIRTWRFEEGNFVRTSEN